MKPLQTKPLIASRNRFFSYSEKNSESNDILLRSAEFSNVHNCIEALTPLDRTLSIQLYKNKNRSRLFGRKAKRSIVARRVRSTDLCFKFEADL